LKYPEKQFELYDKNCFSTIAGQDLFEGRRILICSVNRPSLCFTQLYMKDIEMYSELYKMLGVDEIYFIAPSKLMFTALSNRVQLVPVLGDYDATFIQWLDSKTNNSERSLNFLRSYWSYQVLLNDGEVEHLTQQPLDNYLTTLLKDTKNFRALRAVGLKNDALIWTPSFLERNIKLARDIFYYNLHPNIKLKQHLFSSLPNMVDNKDK